MQWTLIWVAIVLVAVLIVVSVVEMYKWHTNDGVCEAALGQGAVWDGGSDCRPAPVHVNGLT